MERGSRAKIFADLTEAYTQEHPYTKSLISAVLLSDLRKVSPGHFVQDQDSIEDIQRETVQVS